MEHGGRGGNAGDQPPATGGERDVRVVRPSGTGWGVLAPGARRPSVVLEDRSDAVARARRILRNARGGVVEVSDGAGRVVERIEVDAQPRRRLGKVHQLR
ncbi:MAG: DUF2188 domain-containing protein [Actinomycetota bacterium]